MLKNIKPVKLECSLDYYFLYSDTFTKQALNKLKTLSINDTMNILEENFMQDIGVLQNLEKF